VIGGDVGRAGEVLLRVKGGDPRRRPDRHLMNQTMKSQMVLMRNRSNCFAVKSTSSVNLIIGAPMFGRTLAPDIRD
jgi:hypothetical protein